jgi:hypothetical protein
MSVVRHLLGRIAKLTAVVVLVTVATWLSFHILTRRRLDPAGGDQPRPCRERLRRAGMFQNMTSAMGNADFPLLMGMTIAVAALVALGSFLVDVALVFVDPTVREPAAG